MNKTYRNDFASRVNAARTIADINGKVRMISHTAFDEFDAEARAKRASGEISHFDYFNCSCVIGEAVNQPRS